MNCQKCGANLGTMPLNHTVLCMECGTEQRTRGSDDHTAIKARAREIVAFYRAFGPLEELDPLLCEAVKLLAELAGKEGA